MSAAETRQMSSAKTRQMSTGQTGRCPVSPIYICLVSAEDICPVSATDICPVSTAAICLVSTEDIWLLWGHLGRYENDFDPFFTPKMRKKSHERDRHTAPEMGPWPAAQGLRNAPGARIT